jgi:hypothetical protein
VGQTVIAGMLILLCFQQVLTPVLARKYRCAHVSVSDTFHCIPSGYINKWWLSEHKHCDNVATNANTENAKIRMEASSAGKHEYGGKGR